MLMAMTPEDRIWNYTSPRCVKSLIGTVPKYMGAKLWNDRPEFVQNSANIESFKRNYKMSKSLIDTWLIQQFCACFAICQVLCDEMVVPYFLSSSLCTLMWMDVCISYCIYHTELCFSF